MYGVVFIGQHDYMFWRSFTGPSYACYIGAAVICDTGEGCVRTFTERETIEGRRFDAGDTAITVRWYDIHLLTNIESILILRVWVAVQAKARSAGSAKANFRATAS